MIGDEILLKFSGVPLGEACSIVIRGATEQILGEAERSLHDALCVLTSTVKNTKTVLGGGQFLVGSYFLQAVIILCFLPLEAALALGRFEKFMDQGHEFVTKYASLKISPEVNCLEVITDNNVALCCTSQVFQDGKMYYTAQ